MDTTDMFARDLASTFPWFADPLEPYLDDAYAGYAYVFLALEVTPEILEAYNTDNSSEIVTGLDWRELLRFLDGWMERGDPDVVNVIKASFLQQLPYPGVLGYGIVDELPSGLGAVFKEVRPGG